VDEGARIDPFDVLKTAQTLMFQNRFQDALSALDPLGQTDDSDALYMRAVCHRYLGRPDKAEAVLATLRQVAPGFGRAHQEEGHLMRMLGRPDRALAAYRNATALNPALTASWQAQAELLEALGQTQPAAQARAQVERLNALPRELLAVTNHLHEDKLLKAEKLCRAFLRRRPHHVEAMRLLAKIGLRFGVLNEADFLLESALELEPSNIQVRLDYIEVLRKRQKFHAALEQARRLYDSDPDNPVFQSHYAIESLQVGDFERALTLFDQVLQRLPGDAATLTSRGHALKTYGRQSDAIASYQAAYRAKPDHAEAYAALANLKTYRFSAEELAAMTALEAEPALLPQARISLCFSLGKALEDAGDYAAAFAYYDRGNALKRAQSGYSADRMEEEFQAQIRYCTAELFQAKAGAGDAAGDPIFIVGLPRAGSTLIEQILASHSQIDGTLELPNILSMVQRLRGRSRAGTGRYPAVLHDLEADTLAQLGRQYLDETRLHRQGAPFFTDKMPNNFRHIGLIHLILPNARIIDARRDAMACCFSGFKQLFAEGQEFTYGLEQIGRYYRGYVRLMDHWDTVLPGKILRVQHEEVIADLDGQVRRLLDFLGLPFEPACVDFHKTERAVRTASSEQVRRPISAEGMDRWRRFEPFLDPLKQALGNLAKQTS